MRAPHFRTAAIALVAGIGLSGCATYSPFGYGSGVSIGYSSGYGGYGGYYDPFYDPYYSGYRSNYGSRYGGYYGSPYGGWYNNFYYPGFGRYVYDRQKRRRVWNDGLRDYWSTRRAGLEASGVTNPAVTSSGTIRQSRALRERPARDRVTSVEGTQPAAVERTRRAAVERSQARTERNSAASARRAERAADRAARRGDRD